jgi:nitroreductase
MGSLRRTIGGMSGAFPIADNAAYQAIAGVIESRRTNLRIDPDRTIDPALITELCRLATWAPNHRLTEPWRFAVLTGDARGELGLRTAEYQAERGDTNPARINKTRGKYLRAPISLVVGCVFDENPEVHREDRDAVAAAVQNILLGATAMGLASYWGSGLVTESPRVKSLCGLAIKDEVLAVLYLGWPTSEIASPGRSAPQMRWIDTA